MPVAGVIWWVLCLTQVAYGLVQGVGVTGGLFFAARCVTGGLCLPQGKVLASVTLTAGIPLRVPVAHPL